MGISFLPPLVEGIKIVQLPEGTVEWHWNEVIILLSSYLLEVLGVFSEAAGTAALDLKQSFCFISVLRSPAFRP